MISGGSTCVYGGVHGCFHLAGIISGMVINPCNFIVNHCVMLALIFLSRKLRDNNSASVAPGRGGDGKDNKVELPYSTLSLLPTVVAMSPLGRTSAPLAVAGYMARAAGRFGSVVLFLVALAGALCSKRLCFEAPLVATAVLFAAAGLTDAGLSVLVVAAIPPFGLCLVLFVGAMVVDVMFGLWLCVLCQICQIHCNVEE
jgi:hypothetical protein